MTTNNGNNEEEELSPEMDDEQIQEEEWEALEEKDEQSLFYTKRLKLFIREIADFDKFEDIRFGKKGLKTLQEAYRFIAAMLTYEMIESLKKHKRKTISPVIVNEALSRMLGKADSLGITVSELEKLITSLELQNNNTSITKAMDYVNRVERISQEDQTQ